jgi:Spy/CpxP family protein refolding chaperone
MELSIMSKMMKILFLAGLILILLPTGVIFAQGHPPSAEDRSERREDREKIRENIETLRMWKLLEALDLTSEQSDKFLPIFKDFQRARRDFEDQRRELMRKLEAAMQGTPEEKQVREILADLEINRKQFQSEFDKYMDRTRTVLSIEQQAKLALFEDQFERRMRETIDQIRGGGHSQRKGF